MKKAILQYASGGAYNALLDMTQPRHSQYCKDFGAEYIRVDTTAPQEVSQRRAGWMKVTLIRELLEKGYDQIIYLDADTVIHDFWFNLFDVPRLHLGVTQHIDGDSYHYNTGVIFITNTDETLDFIKLWESKPENSHAWMEQWAFNELMKDDKYYNLVTVLSNSFNTQDHVCPSDNPIIKAFHGRRDRFEAMRECLRLDRVSTPVPRKGWGYAQEQTARREEND